MTAKERRQMRRLELENERLKESSSKAHAAYREEMIRAVDLQIKIEAIAEIMEINK